ncbi:hypothetical protein MPER_15338, partial [Moniliophthora perniciosa FA553]
PVLEHFAKESLPEVFRMVLNLATADVVTEDILVSCMSNPFWPLDMAEVLSTRLHDRTKISPNTSDAARATDGIAQPRSEAVVKYYGIEEEEEDKLLYVARYGNLAHFDSEEAVSHLPFGPKVTENLMLAAAACPD